MAVATGNGQAALSILVAVLLLLVLDATLRAVSRTRTGRVAHKCGSAQYYPFLLPLCERCFC